MEELLSQGDPIDRLYEFVVGLDPGVLDELEE